MRIEIWLQERFHHKMSDFNEKILKFLICPKTGSKLFYDKKKKFCIPKIGRIIIKLKIIS